MTPVSARPGGGRLAVAAVVVVEFGVAPKKLSNELARLPGAEP